jgi:uncharacterized protein YecE (DUF72 family)
MAIHVGTSGWQYRHWRNGTFYPERLPQARWLEYFADRFSTVESNNAFYRLPERSVFEAWARRTPDDFVMAVKVSRYLTHIKRLAEPDESVERFVTRARGLGRKLGPALLQLPPSMRIDLERLDRTLRLFPKDIRVAVEPRHATWWVDETRQLLTEHGAALCLADGIIRTPVWRTADWGYLRMHSGHATPRPCYGRAALHAWAGRLAELWPATADVFVYFNNDPRGCAPRDAVWFAGACARAGLQPTRVARVRETKVA